MKLFTTQPRFVPGQFVLALDSREIYQVVREDPPRSNVWLVESVEGELYRKGGRILEDTRKVLN
jgi:hypothetical protein